jgi:beta-glucosidase/6-phospho-beta-glucosidase/beta-galactosidase
MPSREGAPFPHLGAFESTRIIGSGTDILGTTRHVERWEHDLELLRLAGLTELRYSIPWHRIEQTPGVYDFSWIDGPMRYMEAHGMRPILDPLHHVSFPEWLEHGFDHPEFPELYTRFVVKVAERYPWADRYTVFNEPLPTTLFCSLNGLWYPHKASDECFVRMSVNTGRAICLASAALRRLNPHVELVHVETAEVHRALDRKSERWVAFANRRRFMMHDLALGLVDRQHELYPYLAANGFTDADMHWLQENRATFDVLGLDYYVHSEMEWYWDRKLGRANIGGPVRRADGFASLGKVYADRFQTPIMLTETNIRGTFPDRLTWLKFMEEQCEALAEETEFRGFCWYPSIDSTDWCHLCLKASCSVDPQGIWGLDATRWHRESSELSEFYTALAQGTVRAKDIPAYDFEPGLAHRLEGFSHLMAHWPERQDQLELLSA